MALAVVSSSIPTCVKAFCQIQIVDRKELMISSFFGRLKGASGKMMSIIPIKVNVSGISSNHIAPIMATNTKPEYSAKAI